MLAVIINGSVAGELHRLADNRLRLRYHEDYRTIPTATPLSVSMPVELEEHSDQRVSPWLWGLLPDNADVLARWGPRLRRVHRQPVSAVGNQGWI